MPPQLKAYSDIIISYNAKVCYIMSYQWQFYNLSSVVKWFVCKKHKVTIWRNNIVKLWAYVIA